jgi:DNA-binding NarL/FixJ family response regulator
METPEISVLIADNQFLITETLVGFIRQTFQWNVIRVVDNKHDLRGEIGKPVSLLIMDYNCMDFDGVPEIQSILSNSRIPVLILTNTITKAELAELNAIGIRNILFKSVDREELKTALEMTVKGRKYVCQEVMDMLVEPHESRKSLYENTSLTGSETEIVRLIAEGLTTKEIALRKHISSHTVMTHRKNIFRKLKVNNASELVMYAIRSGIIDTIEYHI